MTTHPAFDEREHLKRRNTTIAVVFAAVLCIVAVVMAVNSLSSIGEGSEDPFGELGGPPGAGASSPATPSGSGPPPSAPAELTSFSSPSGNIGCVISTEVARCDIRERDWDPGPPPETCKKTWGQGTAVGAKEAVISCTRGSVLGSKTVLEYGRSVTEGNFTCTSSEAGMRCENTATGRGFSISRKTYTFF